MIVDREQGLRAEIIRSDDSYRLVIPVMSIDRFMWGRLEDDFKQRMLADALHNFGHVLARHVANGIKVEDKTCRSR